MDKDHPPPIKRGRLQTIQQQGQENQAGKQTQQQDTDWLDILLRQSDQFLKRPPVQDASVDQGDPRTPERMTQQQSLRSQKDVPRGPIEKDSIRHFRGDPIQFPDSLLFTNEKKPRHHLNYNLLARFVFEVFTLSGKQIRDDQRQSRGAVFESPPAPHRGRPSTGEDSPAGFRHNLYQRRAAEALLTDLRGNKTPRKNELRRKLYALLPEEYRRQRQRLGLPTGFTSKEQEEEGPFKTAR